MTVFVDGMPAARRLDRTDVGTIIIGSPDVLLGESVFGALTPFQAEWLYKYLDSQRETIPFEFVDNGCEVRADRMCELISSLGIPVAKQWVLATSGQLEVAIPKYPRGGVKWDWHVAPVVHVGRPDGIQPMVIDPSLELGRPVTIHEWIGKQSKNPVTTITSATSKDVYRRGWEPQPRSWNDASNKLADSATTSRDLNIFREARAGLAEGSNRRIPNHPVHY